MYTFCLEHHVVSNNINYVCVMPRSDREERADSHFTCIYQNSVTDPSSDVQSNVAPPQTSTTEPTGNALHSFLRGLGMSDRSVSCVL